MKIIVTLLCSAIISAAPALADEREDALELFAAYQTGYLQVAAVSCFQLYSSSGIVSTDYLNGFIDSATAQQAMDHNRLLLSTCLTSLDAIRERTPAEDREALLEFSRLQSMLDALRQYMDAANEFLLDPTQKSADAADAAQLTLDRAMEKFAGPPVE